LALEVERELG